MARITLGKVAERPGDASTSTATSSGSSGALEFITSVTATNSSVVSSGSFASVATKYIAIMGVVTNLRTATVSHVAVRTSSDGSNYSATTAAYKKAGICNTATQGAIDTLTSSATEMIKITSDIAAGFLATSLGAALSARIVLSNLNATATSAFPMLMIETTYQAVNETAGSGVFGKRSEAIAQQGLQLVNFGGGNFIDGRLDIFGIKGSA